METPEIVNNSVPDHVKRKREKIEEEERGKVLNQARDFEEGQNWQERGIEQKM